MIRDSLTEESFEGRITFTLDEEEGSVIALYKDILRLRQWRPDLRRLIGAVCFADDEFIVQLQAADLLANLTYKWYREKVEGRAKGVEPPELLKGLLVDPCTGYAFVRNELWDAERLEYGIQQLIEANKSGDAP
jgi:hypothetical protein